MDLIVIFDYLQSWAFATQIVPPVSVLGTVGIDIRYSKRLKGFGIVIGIGILNKSKNFKNL